MVLNQPNSRRGTYTRRRIILTEREKSAKEQVKLNAIRLRFVTRMKMTQDHQVFETTQKKYSIFPCASSSEILKRDRHPIFRA